MNLPKTVALSDPVVVRRIEHAANMAKWRLFLDGLAGCAMLLLSSVRLRKTKGPLTDSLVQDPRQPLL